jgi:hypothetical protein
MKIRWLQHPTKPQLNNTEQHVSIPYVDPPTWEAVDTDGGRYSVCRIIKRHGFESTSYATPPADCPANVAKRWEEMKGATPQPAIDQSVLEQARAAQAAYNEKAKTFRRY